MITALLLVMIMPAYSQEVAIDLSMAYKIRQEGQRNSDIETLAYIMTDLAGPRLTGSPGIDRAGLPGFQFIQDEIEYGRGYHTLADTWERLLLPNLRHNAIITAWMAWNAAMEDSLIPASPGCSQRNRGRLMASDNRNLRGIIWLFFYPFEVKHECIFKRRGLQPFKTA